MATFASTSISVTDGIVYATQVPLTSSEADLWNGANPHPIQVAYGQAIQAVVQLTPQDITGLSNSYVILQTDLGNDVWVDVAWLVFTTAKITQPATFVLSGGTAGANAFQQSRASGQFPTPQAVGSNQIPLGGRCRFVGKSLLYGGSSSSPGRTAGVIVDIKYKLLGLR